MQMKDMGMKDMDMKCMHMKESDMHDMHQSANDSKAKSHHAVGVVKSVNPDKASVTLVHEPVESIGWPAMTMAFAVKDKALLKNVAPGKKVEFDFVQQGSQYVITAIK